VKVMGRSTIETVDVRADGKGLSSRAGTVLLVLLAQRLGLTDGLSAALAGQSSLFGGVASVSTARRVLLSIGETEIDRVRHARAVARGRAWAAGAAPERVILDFDATPISVHSEKDQACGCRELDHAAISYSWMSPPRRSRRATEGG
jgi:hypothetical protein